jgi:LmbE family N-acetylglucosaminyl deacetylase
MKQMPKETRPKLQCMAFSNDCIEKLGEPDLIVDITSVQDKKIECILSHETQTSAVMDNLAEKLINKEKDALEWISTERFWTYSF